MSRDPVVQLDRRYLDKRGVEVRVIAYDRAKQQVFFTRPNYEHECMQPVWKFQQYFERIDE
ncbi:DUF4222 domain-containing protein [Serratia marcescens]|uniref:DUF4222 domain-containing protein n=1 Tax=Serratia marcescens TaxID=615 RepID=UPI003982E374